MRGGKREGAGRKAGSVKHNNRKKISITLPMDLVEWLRAQDLSQAKVIEKALRTWVSRSRNKPCVLSLERKEIVEAYLFLRKNNHSIPDHTLDFIKDASLAAYDLLIKDNILREREASYYNEHSKNEYR